MRIIHTADLHLDSSFEANLNSIKAKERKRELLLSFEALVNYAKENNVKAIIIAGDLFDKPRVSMKTRDFILDVIKDNPNIDFIYTSGNHDEDFFVTSMIEKPENFYVFSSTWETIHYDDIDITGIAYYEDLKPIIYDSLALNEKKKNIVVMHGEISKYDKNGTINIKRLQDRGIDYLALGHIHKYERGEIDKRGIYTYCGCLEGRGFDEVGPKGFVLLDINSIEIKTQFIKFSRRDVHEVIVDISDSDSWGDIRRAVNLRLNGIESKDMVLIKLVGEYDLGLIKQIEILEESLNEQFYFSKVKDFTKIRINPKDYENDISLKGEFIRSVLASNLDDDTKTQIIEYGIKALMKEDL